MKEYKIEMLMKGEWKRARQPWGILPAGDVKTKKDADKLIKKTKKLWEEFDRRFDGKYSIPSGYRVLSRQVTEWKEE